MGQIIIGIQKSQERPFYFPHKNEEVMKLVLETKILEGDMVSQRWNPDPFENNSADICSLIGFLGSKKRTLR
jgi:hypothetical protein